MKLAVILPAYNHLAEVMTALNSLRALRACDDTVFHVQDDASPEVKFPAVIPPEIASVARNAHNGGFAANCNAGAATVLDERAADVLLFCNQDVSADPQWSQGWDAALLNAFADPTVGIVGARLLFPNGSVQNAGGVFDQLAQPVHRCLGWTNPHAGLCSTPCDVDWTTGAALAVRADVFMRLGGFDERYRMYFEDADLCLRVRQTGLRVRYEPRCTLLHAVGSTGGSPHFFKSAQTFKQQWVDSGWIKPGQLTPTARYW